LQYDLLYAPDGTQEGV